MSKGRLKPARAVKAQLAAAQAVLSAAGLADSWLVAGRHFQLKIRDRRGGVHKIALSCSPSDETAAANNARQDATRLVAALRLGGVL